MRRRNVNRETCPTHRQASSHFLARSLTQLSKKSIHRKVCASAPRELKKGPRDSAKIEARARPQGASNKAALTEGGREEGEALPRGKPRRRTSLSRCDREYSSTATTTIQRAIAASFSRNEGKQSGSRRRSPEPQRVPRLVRASALCFAREEPRERQREN